jgi:hypothetical protein
LLTETSVEKLIGFVENEHLDVACAKVAAANHVSNASRGSRDDVLAVVKLADVLADICSSNARMALYVHVVTETHDDLLNLGRKFTGGRQHECCVLSV